MRIPTEYETRSKPQFIHDCDACVFVGHRSGYDIYVCPQVGSIPTVIARFGNRGSEYASGENFVTSGHFFTDGEARRSNKAGRLHTLCTAEVLTPSIVGTLEKDPVLFDPRPSWESVAAAVIVAYVLVNGLITAKTPEPRPMAVAA